MSTNSHRVLALALALVLGPMVARAVPPPVPADFVLTSDFGPRDAPGGTPFHSGIDYGAVGGSGRTLGRALPAIEGATIRNIGRSSTLGWNVELQVSNPIERDWTYAHLFLTTARLRGNALGRFMLTTQQGEFVIIRFTDETRTTAERAYSRQANLPILAPLPNDFTVLLTTAVVAAGELFAPTGQSGLRGRHARPHLHLALNFTPGTLIGDNPFRFVDHDSSGSPAIKPFLPNAAVPGQGPLEFGKQLNLDRTFSFQVDTRGERGFDLDQVHVTLTGPDGVSRNLGLPNRALFDFGGRRVGGDGGQDVFPTQTSTHTRRFASDNLDSAMGYVSPRKNGLDVFRFKLAPNLRASLIPGDYQLGIAVTKLSGTAASELVPFKIVADRTPHVAISTEGATASYDYGTSRFTAQIPVLATAPANLVELQVWRSSVPAALGERIQVLPASGLSFSSTLILPGDGQYAVIAKDETNAHFGVSFALITTTLVNPTLLLGATESMTIENAFAVTDATTGVQYHTNAAGITGSLRTAVLDLKRTAAPSEGGLTPLGGRWLVSPPSPGSMFVSHVTIQGLQEIRTKLEDGGPFVALGTAAALVGGPSLESFLESSEDAQFSQPSSSRLDRERASRFVFSSQSNLSAPLETAYDAFTVDLPLSRYYRLREDFLPDGAGMCVNPGSSAACANPGRGGLAVERFQFPLITRSTAVLLMMTNPDPTFPGPFNTPVGQNVLVDLPGIRVQYEQVDRVGDTAAASPEAVELVAPPRYVEIAASETLLLNLPDRSGGVLATLPFYVADDLIPGWEQNIRLLAGTADGEFWADITQEVDTVAKTVKGRIPPELGHGATLKLMRFDGRPPAAVTELGPAAVGRDFIAMTWRTSGDDGLEGEGAGEEVRYSEDAAFLSDFELGNRVGDEASESDGDLAPAGLEAGVTIDGLTPDTVYYIGVRSFDRAGNFATAYSQAIRTGTLFRRESSGLIAGLPELTIEAEQPVGAARCPSPSVADEALPHQGIERVGAVYCLGPHRQGFSPPAELLMRYDPAVAAAKRVDPASLAIFERVSEDLSPQVLEAFGAVPGTYFEAFAQTATQSGNGVEALVAFMSSTFVVAGLAPEVSVASTRTIRGTPELRLNSRDRLLAIEPVEPSSPAVSSALSALTAQGLTLASTLYHVTPDVPFFFPAGALAVRIDTAAVVSGLSFDTATFVLYQIADGGLSFSPVPGQSLSQDAATITAAISSTPVLGVLGRLKAPAAPPDPAESRQFSFTFNMGSAGGAPGQFSLPEDAAIDSKGNLYVADRQNYRIQKFDPNGTFIRQWGSEGSGPGQFGLGPLGLSICQAAGPDYVLATDAVNRMVSIFSPDGGFIGRFGPAVAPGDEFSQPSGAVCDAQGNVYVTDFIRNRLFKTNLSGQLIASWPIPSHPQLSRMWHAVVDDAAGVIYVSANDKVAKFTLGGAFLGVVGAGIFNQDGNLQSARGVALDSFRNLYVTGGCQTNRCVQVFRPDGSFLAKFGTPGSGAGQLNGQAPDGLAVDPRTGRVWVADTWNNRLAAFDVAIPTTDIRAPHTSFAPVGPAVPDPMFSPEVQVLSPSTLIGLAPADTASAGVTPSGVAYTEYRLDGGAFVRYSSPFSPGVVFNSQGYRTIEFRSVDNAGNVEPLKLTRFDIDFHAPQSAVYVDGFQATTPSGSTATAQLSVLATTLSTITVFAQDSGLPRTSGRGTITLLVDGAAASVRTSSFSPYSFSALPTTTALELPGPLTAGGHTLTWFATDAVGNSEASRSVTFEVNPPPEDPAVISAYRTATTFAEGSVSPGADIAVDFRRNTFLLNPNSFTVYKFGADGALDWSQTLFPLSQDPGIGVGVAFRIVSNLIQQESVLVVMGDTVYLMTTAGGTSVVPSAFGGFSLGRPSDAAFDPVSNIYVSSLDQGRIFKFNNQMGILAAIGSPGMGDGEFRTGPNRLAIDRFGNIYAADGGHGRIIHFDPSGNYVRTLSGSFTSASGLATDYYGNVYVAEAGTRWIHVFNSTGGFVRRFAGPDASAWGGIDVHPVTGRVYGADGAARNITVLTPDPAPGAVVDLAASVTPEGDALLTWSAAGEDGAAGTASAYDLRFSSRPIDGLEDFAAATSAGNLAEPRPAGQGERFLVGGLDGATSYYFALRSIDAGGTASPLSNTAAVLTPFIARSTTTVLASPELLFTAARPVTAAIISTISTVGAIVVGTATSQGLVAVSNIFDLGPEGGYSPPALLVIRYSTEALAAAGLAAEDVAIYHFDPVLGLTFVPGQTRNPQDHSISVSLADIASIFGAFAIGRDHAAPVTRIAVLGPAFSEEGGPLHIATHSHLRLDTFDPVVLATASGVRLTEYRIDSGSTTAFAPYAGPFDLPTGIHSLEFRSMDFAGNVEGVQIRDFVVDGAAPVFAFAVSGPHHRETDVLFLSPASTLSVTARDEPAEANAGLTEFTLSVDAATTTQAAPRIDLHLAAGSHSVSAWGADRVGNAAPPSSAAVRVDSAAPISTLAFVGPSTTTASQGQIVSTRTLFVLTADDAPFAGVSAGVKGVRYSLDGSTAAYSAPFSLGIGSHSLIVSASDRVDNEEAPRTFAVFVDGVPPLITISSPAVGSRFVARRGAILVSFTAIDGLAEAPAVARLVQVEDRGSPRGQRPNAIDAESGQTFEPLELDDGLWELRVAAVDDVDNATQAVFGPFEVVHDVLPPRIALSFEGDWIEGVPGGPMVLSPNTLAVLESTDDLVTGGDAAGLGVAAHELRIGSGPLADFRNPNPLPDASFRSTFSLAGAADGVHSLAFTAVDVLGNREKLRVSSIAVDGTAPVSSLSGAGIPAVEPGSFYSSASSPFSLDVQDPIVNGVASGVAGVFLHDNGTTLAISSGDFSLAEGHHILSFQARDRVGNLEQRRSTTALVDGTPPRSVLSLYGGTQALGENGGLYVSSDTRLLLSAADPLVAEVASGVDYIRWADDGGTFQTYAIPISLAEGAHTLVYQAQDRVQNMEVPQSTAVIIDASAPGTTIHFGGPHLDSADGGHYVTPDTPVSLTAADPALPGETAGSGVERIVVAVDGGAFMSYSLPLTFPEGRHSFLFRALDRVGNVEGVRTLAVRSDATPPETSIAVQGGRQAPGPDLASFYASSDTRLALLAADPVVADVASGVESTRWGETGGPLQSYLAPIGLPEGVHPISYHSVDRVANAEAARSTTVLVDATPPVSQLTLTGPRHARTPGDDSVGGTPFISPTTLIDLTAHDPLVNGVASGLERTLVSVDGGTFLPAAPMTFTQEGGHTVAYRSYDRVSNEEATRTLSLSLDSTPPATELSFDGPALVRAPGTSWVPEEADFFVAPATKLIFTARDPVSAGVASGVRLTRYRIDGGPWLVYAGTFTLPVQGLHLLEWAAEDRAANVESLISKRIAVDDTGPTVLSAIKGPHLDAFGLTLFSSAATVSLTSADPTVAGVAVGAAETYYRLDGGGPIEYISPFSLTPGSHTIQFHGVDLLGNIGPAQTLSVRVLRLLGGGLAGKDSIDGSGNGTISGLIQSNGPLTLTGSLAAIGGAEAFSISVKGNAVLTGSRTEGVRPLASEELGLDSILAALQSSNDNERLPALHLKDGVLRVMNGQTVTLSTGSYLLRGLTLSGNARVLVSGPVRIFVTGTVSINGNSSLNESGLARDLCLFGTAAMAQLSASGVSAVVYLPSAVLDFSGEARFGGSAFAARIALSGNSNLTAAGLDASAPAASNSAAAGGRGGKLAAASDDATFALDAGGLDTTFVMRDVYAFPNPAVRGQRPVLHASVGVADKVTFRIYDIAGTPVREGTIDSAPQIIDDGTGPKYAYEYVWDGHIPSGVYLYVVVAEKNGHAPIKRVGKLAVVR